MKDKDEKIFLRVTTEMRDQIRLEAAARGESESVVVREALREYFSKARAGVSSKNSAGVAEAAEQLILAAAADVKAGAIPLPPKKVAKPKAVSYLRPSPKKPVSKPST